MPIITQRTIAKGTIRPTGYYSAKEDRWYDIDKKGRRTPRGLGVWGRFLWRTKQWLQS